MLNKLALLFSMVMIINGRLLVNNSSIFCDLGVTEWTLNGKWWFEITNKCCGEYKLKELFNRSVYHCLEACYIHRKCTLVYFDEAKRHCVLFKVENYFELHGRGFIIETGPHSSSFIVEVKEKDFGKMVQDSCLCYSHAKILQIF